MLSFIKRYIFRLLAVSKHTFTRMLYISPRSVYMYRYIYIRVKVCLLTASNVIICPLIKCKIFRNIILKRHAKHNVNGHFRSEHCIDFDFPCISYGNIIPAPASNQGHPTKITVIFCLNMIDFINMPNFIWKYIKEVPQNVS